MDASIAISRREFEGRAERLSGYLEREGLNGAVLFDSAYVLYLSGFAFIPTERPIALILGRNGRRALLVPRLEVEHAQAQTGFERVDHYLEYPYHPHPMEVLGDTLRDMGITGRIGADSNGYPWIFGYRGPSLTDVTGGEFVHIAGWLEDQMAIKSDAEVELIRQSAVWGNLAHRLLQRYTAPGRGETEVSLRAGHEATLAMLDALGSRYRAQSMYGEGAVAVYRGQIGRNAAIPHALSNNITFQVGDVLVTGASAPMWGYNSELERTMVIGPPGPEQREMFERMKEAQEVAFDAMKPGVPCSSVDGAVRAYYERHDLMQYWKHHTGHAIGLRYHEGPFLDVGDHTEMRPGMVFTVEPGLYAPQLGGFRHSDTVLITESGTEMLTYYPRDLGSLIIPV